MGWAGSLTFHNRTVLSAPDGGQKIVRCWLPQLEMLVVDRVGPVAAPSPATVGKRQNCLVAVVQQTGIPPRPIEVWPTVLGLRAMTSWYGVDKRVDVDCAAVGVIGPAVGVRDITAVVARGVVVLHGQLVVGIDIVVGG